jgi:hypothetical protein
VATKESLRCAACGYDVRLHRLGLTEEGAYDAACAPQHELSVRIDTFGGRNSLTVERQPLPLPYAIGMRDALRAALARVEAEIAAASG